MTRIHCTLLAFLSPVALLAQGADNSHALPLKYAGPPTVAQITSGDLMTRLYIFADDSMAGRLVGSQGNAKATSYIEKEVRRLGLVPAGDSGGYFQRVPVVVRALDTTSTVTVDGTTFHAGVDFVARSDGAPRKLGSLSVVFGGMRLDTTSLLAPADVRGKVVVLRPFVPSATFNPMASQSAYVQSHGYRAYQEVLEQAAVRAFIMGDRLSPPLVGSSLHPDASDATKPSDAEESVILYITSRMAEALLGMSVADAPKGLAARNVSADVRFIDTPLPARNVVAILPGSDPKLKGQYIAIGAHNDHIGLAPGAVDHDSLKAFMEVVRPQGADSPQRRATADELARIRAITDSLHALHPARLDSINNGADDDGSGSVSVLEIAEAFAKGTVKPRRSILFIWHTGEEAGLWGSEYFTDHPTVPRDSIVAELNMDMVGRGGTSDVTGEDKEGKLLHGGAGYVQLVGSRRLSTELGDLIESVNRDKRLGLTFDYAMDANGHPQIIYCRSDHYEYARYGIPIVFLTTGGHSDYHQVTDEPQYIDYQRMSQVATLVYESALRIGSLDHRLVVDKPKPDPKGSCVQ